MNVYIFRGWRTHSHMVKWCSHLLHLYISKNCTNVLQCSSIGWRTKTMSWVFQSFSSQTCHPVFITITYMDVQHHVVQTCVVGVVQNWSIIPKVKNSKSKSSKVKPIYIAHGDFEAIARCESLDGWVCTVLKDFGRPNLLEQFSWNCFLVQYVLSLALFQ